MNVARLVDLSEEGCASVWKERHFQALGVFVRRVLESRGKGARREDEHLLTERVAQAASSSEAWHVLQKGLDYAKTHMEQGLEDRGDPVDSPELRHFLREQGLEHHCYVAHIGANDEGTDRPRKGKRKLQKWLEQLSFLDTFRDDAGVVCVRVRTQAMHIL